MIKKSLFWIRENFDLASDVISLFVAGYFLFRYQVLDPQHDISQLLLGILGVLTVLAISGIVEKKSRLTRLEKLAKHGNEMTQQIDKLLIEKLKNRVRADEFFLRGQKPEKGFFITANKIFLSGITLSNTIGDLSDVLIERLKAGADIKIIFLSSEHDVIEQVIRRSWEIPPDGYYENRLKITEEFIKIIGKTPAAKGSLAIGILPYVPSFGIAMRDPDTTNGAAYIETYHHNAQGPGPSYLLDVNNDLYWHNFFKEQFELMWEHSEKKVVLEKR